MYNKEQLISIEAKISELYNNAELPYLIHFSGGNEEQLIDIFKDIKKKDYVFSTHRSHYHYLLKGATEAQLIDRIKDGDSMFIFDKSLNFLTTSILAGGAAIAAGLALSIKLKGEKRHVHCFIGDGAEDEGHFYEAVKYVESAKLPCTFIIEDNDRSVSVSKRDRGSSYIMQWPSCVKRYSYKPSHEHAGTGKWIKF